MTNERIPRPILYVLGAVVSGFVGAGFGYVNAVPNSVKYADVNSDGKADIVVVSNDKKIRTVFIQEGNNIYVPLDSLTRAKSDSISKLERTIQSRAGNVLR